MNEKQRENRILSDLIECYNRISSILSEYKDELSDDSVVNEDGLTNTYETDESLDAKKEFKESEIETVSLEQVRTVLANKAKEGKQTQVKELLASFGAKKLSEVNEIDFADLLVQAEAL